MAKSTDSTRRFHTKKQLLSLYLSIGIIGICMLAFSAWTPSSLRAGTAADNNHLLQSEHIPSNSLTDSSPSGDNALTPDANDDDALTATPTPLSSPTPAAPATPTPSPTPTCTPTPTPNPLLTNAYPEINSLVETYYDTKLSGEAEDFSSLVSDPSAIDVDYLHIQYGLVTEFSNFTCYTKNGIGEVAYVVYVSYDSKIVTIDTPVPSLDRLTLVYAEDGSGRLLINTAPTLSDEVTAYCDELFAQADVQDMYTRESQRFEAAIASDPELQQLYNRLDTKGAD